MKKLSRYWLGLTSSLLFSIGLLRAAELLEPSIEASPAQSTLTKEGLPAPSCTAPCEWPLS